MSGLTSPAQAGEPLMQRGSASVTPADDVPTAAVDSLHDGVSPTATANTTATNQVDDDVLGTPAASPLTDDADLSEPAPQGQALPPAP